MPIFLVAQAAQPNPAAGLLLPLVLFAAFWLFFFRPQRAQMKRQREMLSQIQLGDTVRTAGGIIGKIRRLDDDFVVLEVESGQVKIVRRFIAERLPEA